MRWSLLYLLFYPLLLCTSITQASAQNIVENRPFSYGAIVVTNNSNIQTMTVQRNGAINSSSQIIPLQSIDPAQYRFESFPGDTDLNISFSDMTLVGSGGSFFHVENFDIPPNTRTDISGTLLIDVGSTLKTSGNSFIYNDQNYTGSTTLSVSY